MLIDNLRLRGREGLWQLRVADGRIAALVPMEQAVDDAGERLDGAGGLAVPPFIEPHIHLDTTQTAGQPEWNRSGTLFEGIERWAQRKALLSHEDVKQRAWQTLKWQIANGVQHVRSHVDVSDPTLTALKAMLEVRGEVAPWVDLQIVAFPQEGILSYPNGLELLEESLRLGADVVGAIPHFEFTRELGVESLHKAIDLAKRYDLPVDVHCDEIDDEQSRFLETLAMLAHRDGLGARVTASHTTAMHSYNGAYTSRLFRLLKLSGINFVANPLVNIHLQGRFDDYPKRRGITRVKELLGAGINTCFGHDDVFGPLVPAGHREHAASAAHGPARDADDGLRRDRRRPRPDHPQQRPHPRPAGIRHRGRPSGQPAGAAGPRRLRRGAPAGPGALLDPRRTAARRDGPGADHGVPRTGGSGGLHPRQLSLRRSLLAKAPLLRAPIRFRAGPRWSPSAPPFRTACR